METKESLRSEAEIWAVGEEDKRRGMPLPGPLPTSQIEWAVSRCRKGSKEVNILVVYCKAWVSYQSLIWFQVAFSSAVLKALSPILPVHSLKAALPLQSSSNASLRVGPSLQILNHSALYRRYLSDHTARGTLYAVFISRTNSSKSISRHRCFLLPYQLH